MTIGEGWTDQDLTLQNATGTVTWVSGNETVAKVSSTGNPATIEGIAVGSTTITATYAGKSYTCNLTVTPNLSEDAVTVSPENPVYNGGQQIPSVAVQVGDTILKENDQYQLSYAQMVGGAAATFDPATDTTGALVNAGNLLLVHYRTERLQRKDSEGIRDRTEGYIRRGSGSDTAGQY